jgi:membrane-associated HD superfamily phosphohydrolase
MTSDKNLNVVKIFLTLLFFQFLAITCKLASLGLHSTWERSSIIYSGIVGTLSEVLWLVSVIGAVKYRTRLTWGRMSVFIIIAVLFGILIVGVVM